MARQQLTSLLALALLSCATPPPGEQPRAEAAPAAAPAVATAPVPAPAAPETLTADAPRTTPGGATFQAPAGWTLQTHETFVTLSPPESDTRFALVDVQAQGLEEALTAAWKAFAPDMKRPLRESLPRGGRNGWEGRYYAQYVTSPNERRSVSAYANHVGRAWTVFLVDASDSTFGRRLAPFALLLNSLRPAGYTPESFAGKKAHPLDAARIAQMQAFVEQAARELDIPGVGFSLIDGGRVVFEGGVGVRELGKPAKVDADTLFLAGSNTKALTTLLLARLVDAGKLRWDEPVTQVYPSFQLGDAQTTRQVQVKHLICACTGLPRQDLEMIFEGRKLTPRSALTLLSTMQPTTRFGEVFQYSNLMAAAAGYVGGHVLFPGREPGAAYDAAMQRELFEPLGMRRTTFDFPRALRDRNHASAHGLDAEGRTAVAAMAPNSFVVPVRPAGGVWTSTRELSRYVMMELAEGKLPDGRQLVSRENLLARQAPQVPVGEKRTYGMGLDVDTTWGVKVVNHGGSTFGHRSNMLWLPEYGVGAVLLTNADSGSRLLRPFMRRLLELLFDGQAEAADDVALSAKQMRTRAAQMLARLTLPPDPAVTRALAGAYRSPALGNITVRSVGDQTVLDFDEFKTPIATRRNEDGTTSLVTVAPSLSGFDLVVGTGSGKRTLIMRDAQHEYVFEEVAARSAAR